VSWVWARGRRGFGEPVLYWVVAGALVVALPWLVFVAQYRADFAAQLTVYGGERWNLFNPTFYISNLVGEASRYQNLLRLGPTEDPSAASSQASQLLMALAAWPAVAYVALRSRRTQALGDRLLWSSLVIFGGLLVLVDQTKTPLYAVILLPSLCLALAVTSVAMWSPLPKRAIGMSIALSGLLTLIPRGVLVCLGIVVAIEGASAYQAYEAQAAIASQYLGVGFQLEDALAPGAPVLGPERWWWALHFHPYASLRSVWWQWSAAALASQTKDQGPQFVSWVNSNHAEAIIVNDNIRDDVRSFPQALQDQFWAYINSCTTPVLDLTDASYLRIEVNRITRPPPDLEICGGSP